MALISSIGVVMGKYVFKQFNGYTSHAMETQEAILKMIMERNKDCELGRKYDFANIHSIREFQDKVPISTFEDYAPLIDRMVENNEENIITGDKVIRYCASSGSVGKPKLQPKTKRDVWNMYCCGFVGTPGCAALYLESHGKKVKDPMIGPLVMSLNGHKLKNGLMCNGAGQVPFQYLKPILGAFITTPKDILYPEDEEGTNIPYFQLRFCLCNKKVTYLGSMVITLLTQMFEYLEDNWEMICRDIETGTIDPSVKCPPSLRKKYGHMKPNPKRAEELRAIFRQGFDGDPVAFKIWPKLVYGYGMIGSTLTIYSEKLKRYVGDLPMHNMGYAASEGYMAMPVELNATDYVLLPRSLIYEFIPVDGDENARPLTLDQIEVGKDYEIIITNFSGLYRYRILDIVRCTGTYNQSKKIEFLYRSNMGLNVANEKTTTQMLDWVADELQKHFGIEFIGFSYYPDTDDREAHYTLLVETPSDIPTARKKEMEEVFDEKMKLANEKYEKYRRWGMLFDPEIRQLKDGAYQRYKEMLVSQGRVLNQIKPVTVINTPEKKEFFFSEIQ
ncbi:MAG: GH3 auxin-responsive promoter family protein [Clostridia bacterium]|nr:GH3 auxin-responsive promoter family protein [Clostridia bacterium]